MESENSSRFQPTFHNERGDFNPSRNWVGILAVALLLTAALLQTIGAIRLNTNLQAGDQGAYLHLSLAQAEGRKLTDGNRHPLYSALLLPVAERDPRFFARARWFSCAIGMVFLMIIVWWEWKRRRDSLSAVLVLSFLTVHVQMLRTLSEIWCEPLLYLLVFLLWWKTDAWGYKKGESGERGSSRLYVLGGILAGLLYLTKGTGLQVAILFFLTLVLFSKSWKKVLLPIALFLIVSSPLLLWNLSVYGNPLYSFASTHNMWFDEADEIWYENAEALPTLGSYLRSHTAGEILGRFGRGVLLETRMAAQLLWTDWRLPGAEASDPIGIVLTAFKILCVAFLFYVLALSLSRRISPSGIASGAGWAFFGLMVVFFFLAFGWYARLTDEPRFLMTLVPIAAVLAGRFLSKGVYSMGQSSPRLRQALRPILLVYALLVFSWSAAFAWRTSEVPAPTLSPLAGRVLDRASELPEDSKIAFGPSHGLPLWLSRGDLMWRPTPWRIDWERFVTMLDREEIGYVLIDSETLARRPYLEVLNRPGAAEALGWRILFRDRDETNFYLMYQVEGGADHGE